MTEIPLYAFLPEGFTIESGITGYAWWPVLAITVVYYRSKSSVHRGLKIAHILLLFIFTFMASFSSDSLLGLLEGGFARVQFPSTESLNPPALIAIKGVFIASMVADILLGITALAMARKTNRASHWMNKLLPFQAFLGYLCFASKIYVLGGLSRTNTRYAVFLVLPVLTFIWILAVHRFYSLPAISLLLSKPTPK